MEIKFVNLAGKVVAGFMSESGKVYEGPGFKEFLPIVEELEFKATTDIRLVHNKDVCLNIDSYDERSSNKHLNQSVRKSRKLDVSAGDINVGSTELVFNFTDLNLVLYNKYNIPHMLLPLDNKILKDTYRGHVVFMTIHRLNNPNLVSDVYDNGKSYLKVLRESTRFKKNINNKYDEFNSVVEFADGVWDNVDYLDPDFKCNSIKVITIDSISQDALMPGNANSSSTIMIPNKGLMITRDTMFAYKENPSIHNETELVQFKNEVIPGSRFMYFIDNHDEISDRYYSLCGDVYKVPKFKSKSQVMSGLYVVSVDNDFMLKCEKFVELKDLDTVDYIYSSHEEACSGADKATAFAQELREKEFQYQSTLLANKESYEKTTHALRMELEESKLKFDKLTKTNELKHTEQKRNMEYVSMNDKYDNDRRSYRVKSDFEERSYERDSTLETLKTIGGICGVIAGGFLLMGKLNKG